MEIVRGKSIVVNYGLKSSKSVLFNTLMYGSNFVELKIGEKVANFRYNIKRPMKYNYIEKKDELKGFKMGHDTFNPTIIKDLDPEHDFYWVDMPCFVEN